MANKYIDLLNRRRFEYRTYLPIFCPILGERVIFNADGFIHLRFHPNGIPRSTKEQMYKLGLLPLVRPAIHLSQKVEHEKRLIFIGRKKKYARRILKEVEYWGLEAVVGKQGVKLKVILRKIGEGKLHFWSVMKLGENFKAPLRRP